MANPTIMIEVHLEPDSGRVLSALAVLAEMVEDMSWRPEAEAALRVLYDSLQWKSG